jgi:polar amino acid transport system permease protein
MEQLADQFFNFGLMMEASPIIWRGLGMTLLLCLAVIPLGLSGGLLVALASQSRFRTVRILTIIYVDIFRAIPPLVLLIFIYSGLPFAGVRMEPFTAVCLSFLLNNSAYYGEVYRAGIESISAGQTLAARSTGLTSIQAMIYVILPQAIRNVLPDLLSNTVEVVKLTSLASVVALPELLYAADMARSVSYNASPIVMAAAIYLAILWPAIRLMSRFERRIGAKQS